MIRMVIKYHLVESLVMYVFTLNLKVRDHTEFNFFLIMYSFR